MLRLPPCLRSPVAARTALTGLGLASAFALAQPPDQDPSASSSPRAPALSLFAGDSGRPEEEGKGPFQAIRALALATDIPELGPFGLDGKWLVGDADGLKVAAQLGSKVKAMQLNNVPPMVTALAVRPPGKAPGHDRHLVLAHTLPGQSASRILSLRPDKSLQVLADGAGLITGLALGQDGTLYFVDATRRQLRRLSPGGEDSVLASWPSEAAELGGLCLDPATGSLYLVEGHAILSITPEGQREPVLGVPGQGAFSALPHTAHAGQPCLRNPAGLRILGETLTFCDQGNGAVRSFDLRTRVLKTLLRFPSAGAKAPQGELRDLWLLPGGSCMIATDRRLFQLDLAPLAAATAPGPELLPVKKQLEPVAAFTSVPAANPLAGFRAFTPVTAAAGPASLPVMASAFAPAPLQPKDARFLEGVLQILDKTCKLHDLLGVFSNYAKLEAKAREQLNQLADLPAPTGAALGQERQRHAAVLDGVASRLQAFDREFGRLNRGMGSYRKLCLAGNYQAIRDGEQELYDLIAAWSTLEAEVAAATRRTTAALTFMRSLDRRQRTAMAASQPTPLPLAAEPVSRHATLPVDAMVPARSASAPALEPVPADAPPQGVTRTQLKRALNKKRFRLDPLQARLAELRRCAASFATRRQDAPEASEALLCGTLPASPAARAGLAYFQNLPAFMDKTESLLATAHGEVQEAREALPNLEEAALPELEARLETLASQLKGLGIHLDEHHAQAEQHREAFHHALLATAEAQAQAQVVAATMEAMLTQLEAPPQAARTASPAPSRAIPASAMEVPASAMEVPASAMEVPASAMEVPASAEAIPAPPAPEVPVQRAPASSSAPLLSLLSPFQPANKHPLVQLLALAPGYAQGQTFLALDHLLFTSDADLLAFAGTLSQCFNLKTLSLASCAYSGDLRRPLQAMARIQGLETLALPAMGLDSRSIWDLSFLLGATPALNHLDLSGNALTLQDLEGLSGMMSASGTALVYLDVSRNPLGLARQGQQLETFLSRNPHLFSLQLNDCAIGDVLATSIMMTLSEGSNVTYLGLANNNLTLTAARTISALLRANRSLQCLNLGGNHFSEEGYQLILEAVRKHPTLTAINLLGWDPCSAQYHQKANEALLRYRREASKYMKEKV